MMKEIFLLIILNIRSIARIRAVYIIYMVNTLDSTAGYVTNVLGGAFMPDVSKMGRFFFHYIKMGPMILVY